MWPTSHASVRARRRIHSAVAITAVAAASWLVGSATSTVPHAQEAGASVTFTRDVAPILYARCSACHHDGGSAPFPLLTYTQVKQHAAQLVDVTRRRYMPPWKPEPDGSGTFVGANRLSDAELATLAAWVTGGTIEGDPSALPPMPKVTPGWKLGKPDLIVTPAEAFTLGPDGSDAFRIFVIPLPTNVVRYVKGMEFHPGNVRVVHHANIRIDETRTSRTFDEGDPLPGYDGLIAHTAVYPDGHFLGWTPGQVPPLLPKGLAWTLKPNTDLVVELHLQPSGRNEVVRPEIGLFFGADPPERTPTMLRLGKQNIDIAPGEKAHTIRDEYVLPVDATLEAVQPHAHQRARKISATATMPDGRVVPVIRIDDWDFRWQDVYRYVTPLSLPRGTKLSMAITYDNSIDNLRNPWQPPRQVFWGQRSADEMGDVWFQVLAKSERDRLVLLDEFRPKILNEDTFGYEREIIREPQVASLRDSAAMLYLELGRTAKAIEHFAASARLQPDNASAHFNLGTALSIDNRLDDAQAEFTRALLLKPDYGQAHNNLGSLLRQKGDVAGARTHFREALRLDPQNAEAHRNMAGVSRDTGDVPAAIAHYRDAVKIKADWPPVMIELAWLLATTHADTLRDAGQAIRLAERTNELTGKRDPAVMDVLAAAYAAGGDFGRATTMAEAALKLAGSGPAAEAIRVRLDLYRQGRAFVAR